MAKFADVQNIERALDLLNYDQRHPPFYHGHIGTAVLSENGELVIRASHADPRAGVNPEYLRVTVRAGRIRADGYDDTGRAISIRCDPYYTPQHAVDQIIEVADESFGDGGRPSVMAIARALDDFAG